MQVKFKKLHTDAVIPSYAKPGDAGLDLVATSMFINEPDGYVEFGTGLAIEIPENHVGLIFPRSSISNKDVTLSNSVGVVDSQYRGEIKFRFKPTAAGFSGKFELRNYDIGDKVGQLIIMPYPKIEPVEVDELSDTERGSGGFGSTGR